MPAPFPKHYDPSNLIDMHHWCRVVREIYTLSGNRDAVEKTYTMCARIKSARERESHLHRLNEGTSRVTDEDEYPYR